MDNNAKRVLITGATRSIGSVLAERLNRAGWIVRVLMRDPSRAGKLKGLENLEIVQGDLSQLARLHGCMEDCSLVYHCAAKLSGSHWSRFRTINVEGTKALLREAASAGVQRFIHLSTIGVYGCSQAENITENFPWPNTNHPYFKTKQEAEHAAWAAAGTVPIVVARVGDVAGPGQETWTVNFIRRIKQRLLRPPTDRASGILNPVYIENLIDALLLMGKHPAAVGQAFHIVDGTPMRFSDYIRRLIAMTGRPTFPVPSFLLKTAAVIMMSVNLLVGREAAVKLTDVEYLLHKATIRGEKVRTMLGWKPSVGEADAFRATEEWLRREGLLS